LKLLSNKLDEKLNYIRSMILNMGGSVEKTISVAYVMLLKEPSTEQLMQDLLNREKDINALQLKISRACFKILAREAPVARDLRIILAILNVNTDLERIGDLAISITRKASFINKEPVLNESIGFFKKMFDHVSSMVRQSLDAFVDENETMARSILIQDDSVDRVRDKIRINLEEISGRDTYKHLIKKCIDLIIIAGALERIADHATNIAEEIVFLKTGHDIRHQDPSEI